MAFSTLILSSLFVANPAPVPTLNLADLCPKPTVTADSATFNRLIDLPPAQATLAVLRSTGCPTPVIMARDRLGPVPKVRR